MSDVPLIHAEEFWPDREHQSQALDERSPTQNGQEYAVKNGYFPAVLMACQATDDDQREK